MVPTECLIQPAENRCFRSADTGHVDILQKEIAARSTTPTALMCNIPHVDKDSVTEKRLRSGDYLLETIGGNHTRLALQTLAKDNPEEDRYKTWPVAVYCRLEDAQALHLGYLHNRSHEVAKGTSFEDYILFFRRQLDDIVGIPRPSEISSQLKTRWRQKLANILGMKVNSLIHPP